MGHWKNTCKAVSPTAATGDSTKNMFGTPAKDGHYYACYYGCSECSATAPTTHTTTSDPIGNRGKRRAAACADDDEKAKEISEQLGTKRTCSQLGAEGYCSNAAYADLMKVHCCKACQSATESSTVSGNQCKSDMNLATCALSASDKGKYCDCVKPYGFPDCDCAKGDFACEGVKEALGSCSGSKAGIVVAVIMVLLFGIVAGCGFWFWKEKAKKPDLTPA